MLNRLLTMTRGSCGMCGGRFVLGLGYGPFGTSACSARCRRLQLSAAALPRYAVHSPTGRRSAAALWD